jgi:hypothetical protein
MSRIVIVILIYHRHRPVVLVGSNSINVFHRRDFTWRLNFLCGPYRMKLWDLFRKVFVD